MRLKVLKENFKRENKKKKKKQTKNKYETKQNIYNKQKNISESETTKCGAEYVHVRRMYSLQ